MGYFIDDHEDAKWPHGPVSEVDRPWCPRLGKLEQGRAKWLYEILTEHPTQGFLGFLSDGRPQVWTDSHDDCNIATLDLDDLRPSGLYHPGCGSDFCRHIQLFWASNPKDRLIRARRGTVRDAKSMPLGRRTAAAAPSSAAAKPPSTPAVAPLSEPLASGLAQAARQPKPEVAQLEGVAVRQVTPPQAPAAPSATPAEREDAEDAPEELRGTRPQSPKRHARGKRAPASVLRQVIAMPALTSSYTFRLPSGHSLHVSGAQPLKEVADTAVLLGFAPVSTQAPARLASQVLDVNVVVTALQVLGISEGEVARKDLEHQLDPQLQGRTKQQQDEFRNRLGNLLAGQAIRDLLKGFSWRKEGRQSYYRVVKA